MSTGDANASDAISSSPRWIAIWAIFLAATFAFGWYKEYENRQYWAKLKAWNEAQDEFVKNCKVELTRVRNQLHRLQAQTNSQQELERQINGGKPFELITRYGRDLAYWEDTLYGIGGQMEFEASKLMGWRIYGPAIGAFAIHNPQPGRVPFDGAVERIRRWIMRLGLYVWLIGLVAWFAMPRRRRIVAQLLLAAALASGTALLVNPAYSLSWRGVFSNDLLFFAVLTLPTSVILLARSIAAQERPNAENRPLQFRLLHALIATTLVAFILAAGPFGYVTLIVAAVCTALFAIVYYLNRPHHRASTPTAGAASAS